MKKMIGSGLLVFVLAMLAACGGTSSDAAGSSAQTNDSTKNASASEGGEDSSSESVNEGTNESADEVKKEGTDEVVNAEGNSDSSVDSSKDPQDSGSADSGDGKQKVEKSSEDKGIEARKNEVIAAILNYDMNFKGIKEDTKVDYESETVTWGSQKVTLEIVPASDHQDDFKAGTVKAVNANGGDIVGGYRYEIDDDNKLSLIGTMTFNDEPHEYVYYATYIGDSDIHISNGDAAVEYLKQQIEAGKNEDIIFGDLGGSLETDKRGSYYTIRLSSKTMRENGGTGTVNIYKVYQDGSYTSRI